MGTGLTIVALLIGLAGLIYAWLVRQDLDKATRRLDRYNRTLYDASEQIRKLEERQVVTEAELRAEIARSSGRASFRSAMTVRESYALHPQAQEILAAYHMGGCHSCAVELDDTIAQVCTNAGVDVGQVIGDLNTLLAGQPGNGNGNGHANGLQRVKLPNLSLEL
ncbi:MAG: hypothetical protein DWI57_08475 [Chloroflexi bacterium]|nr:MAG: hypothetical protein DWI57_08475 [Chloroflexota bacterium]